MTEQPTADCYPVSAIPGHSRIYLDFCSAAPQTRAFFAAHPGDGRGQPHRHPHRAAVAALLAEQNSDPAVAPALQAFAAGAATVVTGQQVSLFAGPLYTPFKIATAVARARQASRAGHPHAAIFWLASEDHDFEEVNHILFPGRRQMERLEYASAPASASPVGAIVLDDSILPLVERAQQLMEFSEASQFLAAAYRPGRTFAQAFADFYGRIFAAQGLMVVDASGRQFHQLGAPVLRAGIERADEFHAALLERNAALQAAGYHAQVAVNDDSTLLFLIDDKTGARVALKRTQRSIAEPHGLWHAASQTYSTADLLGILDAEPERISPAALLRPVFQDYLLGASLIVGGPAEIAYFAQSAVLYEKILGRQTTPEPRFSASLIEPNIAELLQKHALTVEQVFREDEQSLARMLAERAMPAEGRRRLVDAGKALDAEMEALLSWMRAYDEGLGRSAETAASKMQYQMSRLRTMAENFQLQKESSLARHAQTLATALNPDGVMQERAHAAAYYFARYGVELAERLCAAAEKQCPGHSVLWL